MNGQIEVECELCGMVVGWVPPGEILAGITILNGHLAICEGERVILTDADRADLEATARKNLRRA